MDYESFSQALQRTSIQQPQRVTEEGAKVGTGAEAVPGGGQVRGKAFED